MSDTKRPAPCFLFNQIGVMRKQAATERDSGSTFENANKAGPATSS